MKHYVLEGDSPTDVIEKLNEWCKSHNAENKILIVGGIQSDGQGLFWVSWTRWDR